MTGQRIYPFIVNGQFWCKQAVDEYIIAQGEIIIPVASKMPAEKMKDWNTIQAAEDYAEMKQVRFRLIEAFWLSDDEAYIEDGKIYKK